jgi:hypothetical protein
VIEGDSQDVIPIVLVLPVHQLQGLKFVSAGDELHPEGTVAFPAR